jgi:hypothetical protein
MSSPYVPATEQLVETAKALDLTIPPAVLLRADRMIE